MNIKFIIKQYLKMGVQNIFLPAVYRIYCRKEINSNVVLFADAHHTELPFSMRCLYEEMKKAGMCTEIMVSDYGKDSFPANMKNMIHFMKVYANARCVVICDNFLPVASCKKRPETTVIQLWHACGALKKFGYDTTEDIPSYYKGNVLKNCDYVTVSSKWCVPHFSSAMKLPKERFLASGISRTDFYYRTDFLENVRSRFKKEYPQAQGKKVILWAPTFRGNAAMARVCGEEAVDDLAGRLDEGYYLIKSLHPHLMSKDEPKPGMTAEELLVVTDLLITDYSSILFDYLIFRRPLVLFAPDLDIYEKKRGFYMDYHSLPGTLVTDERELYSGVMKELKEYDLTKMEKTFDTYMGACDGHATERIMEKLLT
ncbi:MAG: CDP-glycerol glycerophosphotransferase family protein [Eubacteriales bacterium]|nr:CDP-glycerol glycerophosphotransferase family protein [Eubacteriales bacterium]